MFDHERIDRLARNLEVHGNDAWAMLLNAQIDSLLQVHYVGRAVNNSRYEGTDTKKPVNSR